MDSLAKSSRPPVGGQLTKGDSPLSIARETNDKVGMNFDDLPMDVFELADSDIKVESLTAGHGMGELDASGPCITSCTSG